MQHLLFNFSTNKLYISTTFEKSIVPNGQKALAELVLGQSWTVTIQKEFGLSSLGFLYKKFDLFYINLITEDFKSNLTSDRSYWLLN